MYNSPNQIMLPEAIKTRFRLLLSIDEPPHRIALAFAVGIFIAFSPTIGLHTLSAVVAAWLFKLNLPVLILATLVNNPWSIVFIYGGCICFGSFILRSETPCYIESLTMEELKSYPQEVLMPYLTGTIIIGIIASLISYFLIYKILVNNRKNKEHKITLQASNNKF